MSICSLVRRNLLLFIQDKTAVFFSFMAVFVVFFLYLCFLKDAMIKPLEAQIMGYAEELCNTWIIAGTLGILSLTTSLSVLGITIHDRSYKILDDFKITPMSQYHITIGYIASTWIITFIISLITLGIGEIYIFHSGGTLLTMQEIFKVCAILILDIFCCTSVLYVVLSFFKRDTSFSNVTTIIGTLSGFLMGIYVPIGTLPDFLQQTIRLFPPSHGASLMRDTMMHSIVQIAFPSIESQVAFKEEFALQFTYGNHLCTPLESCLLLVGVGVIFFCIGCFLPQKS